MTKKSKIPKRKKISIIAQFAAYSFALYNCINTVKSSLFIFPNTCEDTKKSEQICNKLQKDADRLLYLIKNSKEKSVDIRLVKTSRSNAETTPWSSISITTGLIRPLSKLAK